MCCNDGAGCDGGGGGGGNVWMGHALREPSVSALFLSVGREVLQSQNSEYRPDTLVAGDKKEIPRAFLGTGSRGIDPAQKKPGA